MANRVFQSVIYQMKDAIDRVVGVVDETGAVISCSELNLIGEVREGFMAERLTAGDRFVRDGYTYQQFSSAKHNDYAVFVEGADETAGQFAAVRSVEEYAEVCARLDAQPQVGWLEVNISCPNVHGGGAAFGAEPSAAAEVTRAVRAVTKKPIILKLSPTAADIAAVAKACEDEGADGVSRGNLLKQRLHEHARHDGERAHDHVSCEHVAEQTDGERDEAQEGREELDDPHEHVHREAHALRGEALDVADHAVGLASVVDEVHEGEDGERGGGADCAGAGLHSRDQADHVVDQNEQEKRCLLYTSPSPRDRG